jgi:hypothetical protein
MILVMFGEEYKLLSFSLCSLLQRPIQWYQAFLTRVKRLGHEADDPPPAIAEVKNARIYTSTSPYVFMA